MGFLLSSSSGGWKSDIKLWAGLVSFFFIFYLFIVGCMSWVFIAAQWLSLVVASGGACLVAVHGLLVAVAFTCQSTGSRARGLSSCGAWAQLPLGVWDLSFWTKD